MVQICTDDTFPRFFSFFFFNLYVHLYSFNDIFKQSCFPRKIFQKKIRIRKQKVPLQIRMAIFSEN